METRPRHLIQALQLEPHPEGGYYQRVFQSCETVLRPSGVTRSALTTIYFLLVAGSHGRWHSVRSDEAWHHYEGAPLELLTFPPEGGQGQVVYLGPLGRLTAPVQVVPAGWWQAARTLGSYSLVGCTVGPGFEFSDFMLLAEHPQREAIRPLGLDDFMLLL